MHTNTHKRMHYKETCYCNYILPLTDDVCNITLQLLISHSNSDFLYMEAVLLMLPLFS